MHENFPAGRIITGGLGAAACDGLITTKFHLWGDIEVVINPGGSRVYAPGEIKNFYKPVNPNLLPKDMQVPYVYPSDLPWNSGKKQVTIKMEFKGRVYEKDYIINEKPANILINVLSFINNTKERITVAVKQLKAIASKAIIKVRNFRIISRKEP